MELFVLPLNETWTRQTLTDKPVCDPGEQRSTSGKRADASGVLGEENPPGHPSRWDLTGAGSPGLVEKDCCSQSSGRGCAANTGLGTGKAGLSRSREIPSLAQPGTAGSPCGASLLYHASGQAPGLSTVAEERNSQAQYGHVFKVPTSR